MPNSKEGLVLGGHREIWEAVTRTAIVSLGFFVFVFKELADMWLFIYYFSKSVFQRRQSLFHLRLAMAFNLMGLLTRSAGADGLTFVCVLPTVPSDSRSQPSPPHVLALVGEQKREEPAFYY